MINAKQLREMIRADPFKPFRVHLSDGSSYDVLNHDSAFVEQNTLDIGLHPNADGIAADIVRFAILHIVKIEDIPQKKAA